MTDENQVEDQDIELHDENEVMEGKGHDPKNAPAAAVKSVDDAEKAGTTAAPPTAAGATAKHNTTKDPMPKTKAAMINAMYKKMEGMKAGQLKANYGKMMDAMHMKVEGVDMDDDQEVIADINYQADFSSDLNALVESEATLSDEFKAKAETIFEAAIKSKLTEEVDRLEAKYNEELAEEIATTKSDLVEKVDSYLNYVVENWMEENKLAIQSGLRTEIAEGFMNKLKDVFTESYIDVPEAKVDLVDELADTVDELEEKLNKQTAKSIEMAEQLETYKRDAIIAEASKDLADTQAEKLNKLVADIDYEDDETFTQKVATVKESYFNKPAVEKTDMLEGSDDDGIVETSGSMSQYLSAIRKTSK